MRLSAPTTLLASLALMTSLTATSPAQTTLTGQAAMKFLNIGIGARAAGMGYSFVTNTDDLGVVFWNPAGIAHLHGTRAFIDVNSWIADIKQFSFAASHDLADLGVVGLTFTTMDYELFTLLAGHAATAIFSAKLYSTSTRKLSTLQGFLEMLKQPK